MGVRIKGLAETKARLDECARRSRDLTPFLATEAGLAEQLVASAFSSRTSPGGEGWPPTREASTAEDILGGVEIVAGPRKLTFQVVHPAAAYFAFGTRHQPARNFLPFDRMGVEIQSGAAGEFWRGHAERLAAYLEGA